MPLTGRISLGAPPRAPGPRGPFRTLGVSLLARVLRGITRVGALLIMARFFPIDDVRRVRLSARPCHARGGHPRPRDHSLLQRETALGEEKAPWLERAALRVRLATLGPALVLSWLIAWRITGSTELWSLGTLAFAAALTLADFLSGVRPRPGGISRMRPSRSQSCSPGSWSRAGSAWCWAWTSNHSNGSGRKHPRARLVASGPARRDRRACGWRTRIRAEGAFAPVTLYGARAGSGY